MGALTLMFRAEFRRRWRSWLALAVLIGLVGGVYLAAAAAGRRTASAFSDYLAAHGFDSLCSPRAPRLNLRGFPRSARPLSCSERTTANRAAGAPTPSTLSREEVR